MSNGEYCVLGLTGAVIFVFGLSMGSSWAFREGYEQGKAIQPTTQTSQLSTRPSMPSELEKVESE